MNEKKLAENFLLEIERIIKGVSGPSKLEAHQSYKSELELTKFILQKDFSVQSSVKEDLKQRLLAKFNDCHLEEDELSIEDLDYAAGGHAQREDSSCAKCGCKRSRLTITTTLCPECGHPRDEHM